MNIKPDTASWYTTRFITGHLKAFLEQNNYVLSEADRYRTGGRYPVFTAARGLSKEIIEVRGTLEKEWLPATGPGGNRVQTLSATLLHPFSLWTARYGEERNRSVCVPDLITTREMLHRLSDYFACNQLYLKIYLVDQTGKVSVIQLNPHKKSCGFC